MRYSKKRVLVIVFVAWCILFIFCVFFPLLLFAPIKSKFYEIIFFCILPGGFIVDFLETHKLGLDGWYLLHAQPIILIIVMCLAFIVSPGFYLGITYLIMRRMERYSINSKTNNGNITTLFGSNDKI